LWLPNRLVLILALVGVLIAPFLTPDVSWLDRALGGIGGFLSLEVIRQSFRIAYKQDGMGGGDPKLFGAIGIWLGWQALPITLLLSCLVGFAFILATYVSAKKRALQLPFGSFLCVAAYILAVVRFAL
jgi:leader peptidase (prepilin peptidase)/N-methyltransferase